jgi:hypothetical protein
MDKILTEAELLQFQKEGFVVKSVLAHEDIERYISAINLKRPRQSSDAPKMCNIQFLQPKTAIKDIQSIIINSSILDVCRAVLGGGEIVLDGASLFFAEKGVDYRQGWHRDVMQMPDDDVQDSWFTPDHFHNNVQVNIPLRADSCLWLVKGSHVRLFNERERTLFRGSRKMALVDDGSEQMGDRLSLLPGQAVFYNNLAIHRGYGGVLAEDRMTIQLGFHSTRADPTCHFGVLNYNEYTNEYLQGLDERVRQMLLVHVSKRRAWEDSDIYFQHHRKFVESSFQVK